MSVTDLSVSGSQVPMSSGSQSRVSGSQDSSLDTSKFSPLIGNTHGTSGSSGHLGSSTRSSGSVGQQGNLLVRTWISLIVPLLKQR